MGHETASVSVAWNGAIVPDSTEVLQIKSSPCEIAQSVGKVIEMSCEGDDTKWSILLRNIVLAGKYSICSARYPGDS